MSVLPAVSVIPAKAGTHEHGGWAAGAAASPHPIAAVFMGPAFAGMTKRSLIRAAARAGANP
jgi:hypothetical protein